MWTKLGFGKDLLGGFHEELDRMGGCLRATVETGKWEISPAFDITCHNQLGFTLLVT